MPVRRPLALILGAFALTATPAGAVDVTVHATVSRGDLSTTFPSSQIQLPLVDLDGSGDQQVFVDLPFTVQDRRGNGSGWSLAVASNGFWQSLAPMPGTSASFTQATAGCSSAEECTLPQTTVSYPVAVDAGVAPVRFFNAGTGTGMGTTNVSARFAVTVPGNAFAGDFATTLTLTQAAGP